MGRHLKDIEYRYRDAPQVSEGPTSIHQIQLLKESNRNTQHVITIKSTNNNNKIRYINNKANNSTHIPRAWLQEGKKINSKREYNNQV